MDTKLLNSTEVELVADLLKNIGSYKKLRS